MWSEYLYGIEMATASPQLGWIVLFLGIVLPLAVFYDQLSKLILSCLHKHDAPRSEFGVVRADSFGANTTAQGVEYVNAD